MKKCFDCTPHTMKDWLLLAAGVAAVFAAADWLPGVLRGVGAFLGLLAPFGWGLLLAYVLDIPTRFFAQKLFGGRRGGAMAVSYALFFGALALLAALIVPQLVQSVTTFAGRLGAYEETIRGLLVWVQNTFGIDTATAEQLVQMVGTALQNWFGGLSRSAARAAADFVSGAAGAAGNAVVALAASIYLLSGKEALLRAARACLHAALPPRAAGSVLEICRLANKIFSGYIGGQLVDALLVGGETFALMSIFGLEYAPLLSVLVGVTNIVPVLGPFLGAVPGLIILLLELPWQAAEFAIIIFVVQQVDGNFIAPRILGGATGLPGLGVLLAIVVGGAWFGIPGMVLGADAGRAGGAAQTGCRGRADGPRPG
ncbi:AI-2E family transporter [Gemmiger formicilis]|uniref:AI-2E family transporter n=1 Tax=Gemmiger formicilis TaxID=745368 RepID=UPI00241C85A9|nr:AI-2E family transporter [Gemmiger formicilis]